MLISLVNRYPHLPRVLKYTKGKNVKVFELDQGKTQNLKIATMKKAGIEYDWVTYIPVDFKKESWVEKLTQNGIDRTKRTFSPYMSFPRKRESIFSFPSEYYSLTTNTLRNYSLEKEGFFNTCVVLILMCRKIEKD